MNQEQIKKTAPLIYGAIRKADNVLLHCHVNPDQDSYGSALALYHALRQLGKNATVIKGDNDLLSYLSPLPGYDTIVQKNFFEIDSKDFDLFIIVDSTGLKRISRKDNIVFPKTLKTICIDHHQTEQEICDINLVLPNAPSTTSILYHLFNIWNIVIDEAIATCLLVGLYGDTNDFTNSATTPEALAISAKLAEQHPHALATIQAIQHNDDKRSLLLTQKALATLETHINERVAMIHVPYTVLSEYNIRQEDIERATLADTLVTVADWEIIVSMLETAPGSIRVSFRTNKKEPYNVATIAKSLGGGGHRAAAGVIFENTSLATARHKILEAIAAMYESGHWLP